MILERKEGGEGGREGGRDTERQREALNCCSSYLCIIGWFLLPICALAKDRTCSKEKKYGLRNYLGISG